MSKAPIRELESLEAFLIGTNPATRYIGEILNAHIIVLTQKMESELSQRNYDKASEYLARKKECMSFRQLIKQRIDNIRESQGG